jgi:aminopeptidase N
MTRDAEMSISDYVELVLANIGHETDAWGVTRIPANTALAVATYSAPEKRAALAARWESGLRALIDSAAPASDHQLTFVRAFAAAAHTEGAIADLKAMLDGTLTFDGLEVDQDMRWSLIVGLARAGAFGEAEIAAELERDNTISGQEKAAAARASRPDAEAKAAAWEAVVVSTSTPNETSREISLAFQQPRQDELLAPYVDRYFGAAETVWEHLGTHKASVALAGLFPKYAASPALLAKADAWLETSSAEPAAKRYVREGRDAAARALAAQAKDAAE